MYEFTKKEIRNDFKKTEYGKKVNIYLYTSLISFIGLVLMTLAFLISYIQSKNSVFLIFVLLFGVFSSFALLIMCYFDGKRDGAIEQFKKTLK